jgi:hypothetical protein
MPKLEPFGVTDWHLKVCTIYQTQLIVVLLRIHCAPLQSVKTASEPYHSLWCLHVDHIRSALATTVCNLLLHWHSDELILLLLLRHVLLFLSSNEMQNMGRTLEGWFKAFNYAESAHTMPFYKLTASIADSEEVTMVSEGNWAVAFIEQEGELMDGSNHSLLPFIADPTVVFGQLGELLHLYYLIALRV